MFKPRRGSRRRTSLAVSAKATSGVALLPGIASLVAVHRLKEMACLCGFTRFEAAPTVDEILEDVGLAVRGAPLGTEPD
jgi:hypothetical protein